MRRGPARTNGDGEWADDYDDDGGCSNTIVRREAAAANRIAVAMWPGGLTELSVEAAGVEPAAAAALVEERQAIHQAEARATSIQRRFHNFVSFSPPPRGPIA